MGIKSELHEAILKRGGKVPPYGGIAAAMDELNKLPVGGSGGGDIVNLYIKPGYTEYMWKNADDVDDNSKALTYDEAVDAAEKTVRITSYYGGAVIYATCHSICVNKTEGFVEFNQIDGSKYKVSMA
jgi:hypothetical protein